MNGEQQAQQRPRRARALHAAAITLTVLLAAFAGVRLSGWHAELYPLPALLAFAPYAVGAGALLVAALLLRRHWWLALISAASVLALMAVIDPRTRPAGEPADPRGDGDTQLYGSQEELPFSGPQTGRTLRLTTLNTFWGKADFAQLARLAERERSDVLALQEVNAEALAGLRRAGLLQRYPHQVLGGQRVHDEGLVLSRWPAAPPARDLGLPSVYRPAEIRVPGSEPVLVVSAHPTPPVTPSAQPDWAAWLAALPGPGQLGDRAIVAGDFNATVDHAQFRAVLDRGWLDAALQTGQGLRPTWHGLPLLRLTIDHILLPPEFGVRKYRVDRIDGTDHRAVTTTIVLDE